MTKQHMVTLLDVTARDGLQNESARLSTTQKIELINRAVESGARRLEVASFAHPKYVPQMADAEAVIAGLPSERDGIEYIGLVMNDRGLDRALESGIREVGIVAVATDTFADRNQGQTRQGTVDAGIAMINRAKAAGLRANVTISATFGCPFEGEVDPSVVIEMAKALAQAEPREIAIADTIGVADPFAVRSMIRDLKEALPDMPLRAHFHNTRNTALANVFVAIEEGVHVVDGSLGGIGGCPFAPAATGNVPSEDVAYMLQRMGVDTGYNLSKTVDTVRWLSTIMNKSLPGAVSRAGLFPTDQSQAAAAA